jgi:hypothetical protein
MNAHAKIKAVSTPNDIRVAARALEYAATVLSATPRFPDCRDVFEARKAVYDECVAEMREALENV